MSWGVNKNLNKKRDYHNEEKRGGKFLRDEEAKF